ncbi:hypothetical protein HEP84_29545 [Streptomyces sp. RLB1-33]|nr:hypothetical protein [Streptomyces sp. RLB1-33]QIY72663.1 hypothetical protein HEP84_29545 [Streptomyces sp. RLB1-33]
MRSARMLLATATATAALAIGAPGALAATAGDGGHDDSSYSKEHDRPNGGVHAGGGALTAVRGDDSSRDDSGSDRGKSDSGSDRGKGDSSDSEHGKKGGSDHGKGDDSGSEHRGPRGGMHTGGGALSAVRGDDSSRDDSGSDRGKSDSGSDRGKSDSGSDRDKGDSSDSEHGKKGGSDHGKGDDSGSEHRGPRGGMHTGGGALSAVRSDDWNKDDEKFDPETYKDKGDKGDKGNDDSGSGRGKDDSDSERDKPRGGMHTGGGALATTGTTAGGLAVLALAGAGVYVVRRRRAADGLS